MDIGPIAGSVNVENVAVHFSVSVVYCLTSSIISASVEPLSDDSNLKLTFELLSSRIAHFTLKKKHSLFNDSNFNGILKKYFFISYLLKNVSSG